MSTNLSRDAVEWSAFFIESERAITAYALSLTRDIENAEDLIQDVMVSLVRDGPSPVDRRRFVMRAIRNRAIDMMRRQTARRKRLEGRAEEQSRFFERDSLSTSVCEAEAAERLLATLSATQREVVVLRLYVSFSFAQIADVLDKPLGTITSLYARALERMRESHQQELKDA